MATTSSTGNRWVMSRYALSRTGSASYRRYLRSKQWGFRRVRWFRDRRREGFEPACQVCGITLEAVGTLDLHHNSYGGVDWDEHVQQWVAAEADEDLLPMCRTHHQALHRIMDRGRDYYGWDRHRASIVIAARLRREFLSLSEAEQDQYLKRMLSSRTRETISRTAEVEEHIR